MKNAKKNAKIWGALLGLVAVALFSIGPVVWAQVSRGIYRDQGGMTMHVDTGGEIEVESGGSIDVESGGSLKIAGTAVTSTAAELNALAGTGISATEAGYLNGTVPGTVAVDKAIVPTTDKHIDALVITDGGLALGAGAGTAVTATAAEINQTADSSGRIVNATASTLTVTEALHNGKTIVLDRAAGIAVTLPAASAGLKFRFVVKTTFTSAASIKSVAGADVMTGHAQLGNDSDNATVLWQALAVSTYDTIDLLGTANSTGGIAAQVITIEGLAANLWYVEIIGDAAGTEATPFADTVA